MAFGLVFVAYMSVNYVINSRRIANNPPPLKPVRVLVIGDSHVEKGIDPALFASANNIAQSAEPYYITYWKLLECLRHIHPDTVLLGFNRHHLSGFNDKKLYDAYWSNEMFQRIYPIERLHQLDTIPIDWASFYRAKAKNMGLYRKNRHYGWIGKYTNNKTSVTNDQKQVLQRHYFYNKKNAGISSNSIAYLDSLVNKCAQEKIKLILVGTPVHNNYYKGIPSNFTAEYDKQKQRLQTKGIPVIDLAQSAYPDSLFLNTDHLNAIGAQRFTLELLSQISVAK